MADNPYKDFTEEAIKQLERLEARQKKAQEKLDARYKKNLDTENKTHKKLLSNLAEIRKEKNTIIEKQDKVQARISKEQNKSAKSELRLTQQVRKELGITLDTESQFESITARVTRERAKAAVLSGEEADLAERKDTIMSSVLSDMESQAKAVERALKGDDERAQFEQRRLDIKSMVGDLSEEEKQDLLDGVDYAEKLYNKEQRILQLKDQQKDLYNAMPESLKSAISFGQGLIGTLRKAGAVTAGITILGSILLSALTSFIALDEAADKFNDETKIAISQMGEMQAQANRIVGEFRKIGLEAQDYYDVQKEIVGVLGDSARVSDSIAGAQAVLTKNFGVTNKAAAETFQIFQSLGGVSENTAASLQLQTMELARQAGVAPAKVLEDIAESSDAIYGAFRGNSEELVTAAVQSRRLGTNLKDVLATTDKLLDFESSITKELEASAFVGGQFNLTQARALRAAGDVAGAQEEILRQIQRSGDFRQQDVFTQRALAEAAGMTVDEIARQLTVQDKLNSLSADQRELAEQAIAQGLDISNINDNQLQQEVQKFALQKEQQGQVANLSNAFQGIAATLGASLVPLLEAITPLLTLALTPVQLMAEGLSSIVGFLKENLELVGLLTAATAMYYAYKHRSFLLDKADVAYKKIKLVLTNREIAKEAALAAIKAVSNPVGALAGIAAAALVIGTIGAIRSRSVGDLMINPNGGPVVYSPQEGGLFQGTNNDAAILAPPNALAGNQSSNGTDKLLRSIERLEKAYMRGVQVNLDGQDVMRGLGRVGNETTQNNFSLT